MKCDLCSAEVETKPDKRGSLRLPKGWKQFNGQTICKGCWNKAYVLRAVTFPVASPLGMEWKEFREQLAIAWANTTALSNWTFREMAKADVVRTPKMEKLPKAPSVYLYPGARENFPELSSQSVVATQHAVQGKYNRARLETIWRNEASFSSVRYPAPYIVPAASWSVRWLSKTERVPIVSLPLGGSRVELRLRGSADFRRQLKSLELLIEEKALPGTLEIYRQRASNGDHRGMIKAADPAGGQTVSWRVMVKLVMWLPRSASNGNGVLRVRTDECAFLIAEAANTEPFVLNADHVRRWVAEHSKRLHRMSVDTKFEKRWPAKMRQQMQDNRDVWVSKQNRRLSTWSHQATASMVGYAARRHFGKIEFDGKCKSYVQFPWHELERLLKEKCAINGIEFASATVMDEPSTGTRDNGNSYEKDI
jgi:hypothetical protein